MKGRLSNRTMVAFAGFGIFAGLIFERQWKGDLVAGHIQHQRTDWCELQGHTFMSLAKRIKFRPCDVAFLQQLLSTMSSALSCQGRVARRAEKASVARSVTGQMSAVLRQRRLWVKNRYPKRNSCKWKHGLKPAVPLWFHFDPYPAINYELLSCWHVCLDHATLTLMGRA